MKAMRLKFLLHDILKTSLEMPAPRKRSVASAELDDNDDGHDIHRLSAEQIDLLCTESKKNLRDEVLFMFMLTTGLRVGGAAKVLIRHVADVKNGNYAIKPTGKTKEKGNKFASFVIAPQVQELFRAWLSRGRPADDGPYLFPGRSQGSHISTEAIRTNFGRLCAACGISGPQTHPHAIRHTHAHILLECGNSAEAVSKCLNHSNVATTQQFYLRESAAEVQARCNVPWVAVESESEKRRKALQALPQCLQPVATEGRMDAPTRGTAPERKRRRQAQNDMLTQFLGQT